MTKQKEAIEQALEALDVATKHLEELAEQMALAPVPEGWRLVPDVPTNEMIAALGFGGDVDIAIGHAEISKGIEDVYTAMLAAAPPAQQTQEYQSKNPLGGPAKVFDAMADAIKAGEDYHDVLRQYGFSETHGPTSNKFEVFAHEVAMGAYTPEDAQSRAQALTAGRPLAPNKVEHEPVVNEMTAERAVFFMRRFKHEEKLIGPNEQAALDYVIVMLEQEPVGKVDDLFDEFVIEQRGFDRELLVYASPPPQRKPMTDELPSPDELEALSDGNSGMIYNPGFSIKLDRLARWLREYAAIEAKLKEKNT